MKKIPLLMTLVLLPLAAMAIAKPIVKIGVIAPMSGSQASLGDEIRHALTLAQEDLRSNSYEYQVIIEDDQMSASKTAPAAQKLLNVDRVDALITFSSGTGNVAAPMAERLGVPHISICSDPNVAKGKYNFIHATPPSVEARRFAQEVARRGIKSIAIFELNHQGALAISNAMLKEIEPLGIKVTSRNRVNSGERDFRMPIAKVKSEKPDLLFLILFSPEVELLQKQINEAGLTIPSSGIETFDITEKPELFEGFWYVSSSAVPAALRQRMAQKFNVKKFYLAGFTYDAVNLIAQAAENAAAGESASLREKIARELQSPGRFKSILGPLSADSEGIIQSPALLMQIKNGLPQPLE